MTQLYCYVPDNIAEKIKRKAEQANLSVSKYLAELVKREATNEWPEGYLENVLGRWQGAPLSRESEGSLEERTYHRMFSCKLAQRYSLMQRSKSRTFLWRQA